ncbi:TetR family transcriptional regulator [Streptomyces spinoverrucosus]|uniref:TetR family transcriptional regulator n=1 Tax=Streptomyces spinoverrucosus TaxID=284043 RepID=A0A4Y3VY86_9ACTN|nr:ScbR family autoregulator-binding transcription factor [Streptomyces spinoverrucosus]GEC10620.1 TetR family transcriptional regulator [Streptomyces spinoverrucosus]GHB74780.1 TetR family transcriptional regulator [Streptomyces spinoverrucosus]
MVQQYRAQCTRQELIHSAAEVFHSAGYANSSIHTISSRAAVSNGALHFHFRSKRALGEAIEAAAAQKLLYLTGPVPLRHPDPLRHLVDTSEALAREIMNDVVLRAGFSLGDDASWQGGVDLWEQWHDWVHLMLTVARDQGALAPDVDFEDAVPAITAAVAGFATLSRNRPWGSSSRVVSGFWRLMLPRLLGNGTPQPAAADRAAPMVWPAENSQESCLELEEACCVA